MSPTFTPQPRPQARHPQQRPWRRVEPADRRPHERTVIRAFCAPVVRELPPRRDQHAAGGLW